MKVIKAIDYTDGGKHYNTFELIEYKSYIVAKISQVTTLDEVETVEYKSSVWFPLGGAPCEITQEDIDLLNTTVEDNPIVEGE